MSLKAISEIKCYKSTRNTNMSIESDKDKGKYAYIQIVKYDFSEHHDVIIKSNNDAFFKLR